MNQICWLLEPSFAHGPNPMVSLQSDGSSTILWLVCNLIQPYKISNVPLEPKLVSLKSIYAFEPKHARYKTKQRFKHTRACGGFALLQSQQSTYWPETRDQTGAVPKSRPALF
jgi:hypothetical protein